MNPISDLHIQKHKEHNLLWIVINLLENETEKCSWCFLSAIQSFWLLQVLLYSPFENMNREYLSNTFSNRVSHFSTKYFNTGYSHICSASCLMNVQAMFGIVTIDVGIFNEVVIKHIGIFLFIAWYTKHAPCNVLISTNFIIPVSLNKVSECVFHFLRVMMLTVFFRDAKQFFKDSSFTCCPGYITVLEIWWD